MARARGAFGSSADYLERTRVALVAHGIVDAYLEELAAELNAAAAARSRDPSNVPASALRAVPEAEQFALATARRAQIATCRPPSTLIVSPVT